MFRWISIAIIAVPFIFPVLAEAQSPTDPVTITDADMVGNVSFTSNNTYLLSGLVFVEDGETLTIEAGTVIKARPTTTDGEDTALIVARGGKIFANGTAGNPIIFTAEADDVDDPSDILLSSPTASRGLWGGVIILGRASINTATGINNIEGIDATTEPRGIYGGGSNPDDDDNSGVFRYVSIRHGGAVIGADNEINGLTMGGVGRGTTIEHVEVFYNQDDGFEWFGGTVNTRYLVSAFAGDDSFDYDEGFRGEHQFWFSIQDPSIGDHAGEHDGGTDPEDGTPYARPVIVNATYIGRGAASMGGKDNNGIIFRDNAGGMYYNSIFTEFQGHMLSIEDLDPTRGAQDSKARLDAGDLAFQYNILGSFGAGSTASALGGDAHTAALLADASNVIRIADPMLQGISWNRDEGLDPRPMSTSPALDGSKIWQIPSSLRPNADGRLTQTSYSGAFSRRDLWLEGWTALSELGYIGETELVDDGRRLITDADIVGNVTLTSDTEYVLSGLVFVEDGETLTIEAGTVIKGKPTSAEGEDTALIVARGGKIFANGTAENPIIFTAEADDVDDPNDILLSSPTASRGLWGGVIILGKASINTATGLNNIEGIDATTEPRGIYGGGSNPDDDDNSGVFRYVSIRHGGAVIGADNEINGLTMGGVGRGTTIEHVEVFFNQDDGFEWFGGTVNTRYLVSAFAGDDAYDYDEGFRGEHQYWFSIQDPAIGDHAGEHDGGTDPEDGTPYARPVIVNATYIGRGAGAMGGKDNNGIIFRDNAGGMYYNSIFTEFKGRMLSIEDLDPSKSAQDSKARLEAGDLAFQYNILGAFGAGSTPADLGGDPHTAELLADVSNVIRIADPMLQGISWNRDEGLDPRPMSTSPALDGSKIWQIPATLSPNADGRLTQTSYTGAFSRRDLWLSGWTALSQMGYVGEKEDVVVEGNMRVVTDADIVGNVTFSADSVYILSGLVFVEEGETLTIEPGTVIKGRATSTSGDDSALIVARGGKIFADGTARNPIIFTAEADDVNDPNDILLSSPTASRGLWGGVIILGRASINTATGEGNIEGIDASTEPRGIYGGGRNPNDDDNSGVFRYVSIRHGGTDIGANNEINGLTMGGVGRGTTIEHVEVFYNQDDGFEWFGGTVNTRYLISAFAGDDSFDYDEGFRGEHQFWFSIQDPAIGDHAGEHDGGTDPEDGRPYASPTVMNATYIGRGASSTGGKDNNGIIFRDNAGGMYFNSIFTEFQGLMLSIEDLDPSRSAQDSKARLEAGDLAFQYNILGAFGAGTTPADLGGDLHSRELLANEGNANRITDPMLQGISWNRNRGLDPRPGNNSPAWDATKLMEEPRSSGFFTDVDFAGAFGTENWAANWSALAELGYFSTAPAPVPTPPEEPGIVVPDAFSLSQNSPNPFDVTTNIDYAVSSASHVKIEVYNLLGQRVATVVNDIRLPGYYSEHWDAQHLSSGVYFYRFEATSDGRTAHVFNRKMTLLK